MATLTIADLDNGKRDLETVDAVANSQADTTTTRYGQQTLTLAGALRRLGYQAPVPYASGLTIDSGLTTVERDGVVYAPPVELLPFTTGAWDPDQWRVVQNTWGSGHVHQFPTLGAAEVAAAILPEGSAIIVDGQSQGFVVSGAYVADSGASVVSLADYSELDGYAGNKKIFFIAEARTGGMFVASVSSVPADGGIRRNMANGLQARRVYSGPAMLRWWADPASSDSSAGIQAAFNSGAMFFDGEGATFNVKDVQGAWPLDLKNTNFSKIAGSVDQINSISWESMDQYAPVHHLSFENVHIDGKRVDERSIVALTENGGRSGFRFRGYVEHVRMKNCSAKNCGTDGVIMFAGALPGAKWPAFDNFSFEDCDFSTNRRHGLSFDSVRGLKMVRVKCQNNGNDLAGGPFAWDDGRAGGSHEDTMGQLYGNGVDGESYGAGNHSQDLLFEDCGMTGNARGGLLLLEHDFAVGDTGFTPWSDIKIVRGTYDPGLHSLDGSVITITRNGGGTAVTGPLRSFESLLIDEPYVVGGAGARIVVARASGAIKLSRTRDTYSVLEQVSALRYSNLDIQLHGSDTCYVDGSSRVRKARYLTPSSTALTAPTVSSMSGWTLTGQSTSRAGDGAGVSIFAVTANINTGGNAAATVNISTGGFERCIPTGVSAFDAGGAPIATGFKVSSFSKTGFALNVYTASAPASGKIEISLAAFDF